MMLSNLRVSQRLALGFGAMALLLAAVCAVCGYNANLVKRLVTEDQARLDARASRAQAMVRGVLEQDLRLRQIGLLTDLPEMQRQAALVKEGGKRLLESLEQLGRDDLSADERALLDQVRQLDAQSRPVVDKAMNLAMAVMTEDAAKVLTSQLDPLSAKRLDLLGRFAGLQEQRAQALTAKVAANSAEAVLALSAFAVVGLGLAGLAGWLVTRSIVRPLQDAVDLAGRVADGDLTVRLQHQRGDEIGTLLSALDGMTGRLRGVISTMRQSSESVLMASGEIAAGNHDLSTRTEQQASSLQATVSTVEQMSHSVQRNAQAAQQATHLAAEASSVAAQGGDRVGQVVATMDEISASSRRIADIVGTIDGIAFQTNILALNAAVEAARAGEQGRGFAVVAGEVRSLAQRSAQAAREIKGLISTNVEKVESGTRLVAEAGSTMGDIVRSSEKVAEIIREISDATQQQASGLAQVSESVSRIDEATQQNAALVEQSAAAASSLKEQTQTLNQAVGVFRMDTTVG